ncbi:MAG: hypothetical protein IKP24_02745 [Alphaproteobacteria bacterium]|nr:hypothetical protein [Alphaproteobacteria bacterium]
MQNKKNQSSVGLMIQRCHKWRMRRKQLMDQVRTTTDEIERERLLQAAEHCIRMTNAEQEKIDSMRDSKEKAAAVAAAEAEVAAAEKNADENGGEARNEDEEEMSFPDFITNLN